MRRKVYILFNLIILLFIINSSNIVYGVGRIVDIPVPPNSSGYTDFSPEDGEKRANEYQKEKENKNITAEEYVGKSSNNFLKELRIEGFKISPEFDSKINEYTLDLNNMPTEKINIIAKAEDEKAKIDGDGQIKINEDDFVNINIIAENGNLNVYTIHLKNKVIFEEETQNKLQEKEEQEKNFKEPIIPIMVIIIIVALFLILFIKKFTKSKK